MIYGILSSIVRTFFKENYVEILQMYCTWKVTEKGKDSLGNVIKNHWEIKVHTLLDKIPSCASGNWKNGTA
jgi:hypothetical protein